MYFKITKTISANGADHKKVSAQRNPGCLLFGSLLYFFDKISLLLFTESSEYNTVIQFMGYFCNFGPFVSNNLKTGLLCPVFEWKRIQNFDLGVWYSDDIQYTHHVKIVLYVAVS